GKWRMYIANIEKRHCLRRTYRHRCPFPIRHSPLYMLDSDFHREGGASATKSGLTAAYGGETWSPRGRPGRFRRGVGGLGRVVGVWHAARGAAEAARPRA